MKAYYEKFQEESQNIRVYRNVSHVYAPHFHNNMEIFIVDRGHYTVTRNDTDYDVTDGAICVFDSYDIHSYNVKLSEGENDCVLIIPTRYLSPVKNVKGKCIKNPVIYDKTLCEKLLNIVDEYLNDKGSSLVNVAGVNLLLTLISEKLEYEDEKSKNEDVTIRKILTYIYENFTADIPLTTIAKELGYTPEHLSRVFHKYIEMSVPNYINNLRVEQVEKLKKTRPDKSLNDCIFEAGFNSIQTYYRHKKQYENR